MLRVTGGRRGWITQGLVKSHFFFQVEGSSCQRDGQYFLSQYSLHGNATHPNSVLRLLLIPPKVFHNSSESDVVITMWETSKPGFLWGYSARILRVQFCGFYRDVHLCNPLRKKYRTFPTPRRFPSQWVHTPLHRCDHCSDFCCYRFVFPDLSFDKNRRYSHCFWFSLLIVFMRFLHTVMCIS